MHLQTRLPSRYFVTDDFNLLDMILQHYKQTLAWRPASEVSACFLLSFFSDDLKLASVSIFHSYRQRRSQGGC